MKLKFRVLSVCLVLSFLVMACGSAADDIDTQTVEVEKEDTSAVIISTESMDVQEVVVEAELTQEEKEQLEWQNYMMADIEDSLNVRTEPSIEAELAGKLEKGDRATVLEIGEEWTKIESGELVGYVKNEFCIYGLEALAYAKENCDTIATTMVEGLRIREEMNTESRIMKRLEEGDKMVVDITAAVEDGWVAVIHKDKTCYVSAEYVEVALSVGTGATMEEIEEARRKEEEAKKKAEEAKKQAEAQRAANEAAAANVDDLTLMAAIIYCEAGAEPYETQLAVGAVIMNRVESIGYPNTLHGVIYQRGQFGPARTGKLARIIAQGRATASCYQAAQAALNGEDNTGGCLRFNDHNGTRSGLVLGGMIFW